MSFKNLLLVLILTSFSEFGFGATYKLTNSEIQQAIKMFDRINVPNSASLSVPCSLHKVRVTGRTMGFNPTHWTVATAGRLYRLTARETRFAIRLFDRVNVPMKALGIKTVTSATIASKLCGMMGPGGFNPARWTISY
jgi:hypothetical protein